MKKLILFLLVLAVATLAYAGGFDGTKGVRYTTVKADSAINASSADSVAHKKPDFGVDLMAESLAVKAPLASPTFTGIDTSAGKAVRDSIRAVKALIGGAGWRGVATGTAAMIKDTVAVTGLAAGDYVEANWSGATAATAPLTSVTATGVIYVYCVNADSIKFKAEGYRWLWIK
jgi:hypothetical protein